MEQLYKSEGRLVTRHFCNNIRKEGPLMEWLLSVQQVNPIHLLHLPTEYSEWAATLFICFLEDKRQGSQEIK